MRKLAWPGEPARSAVAVALMFATTSAIIGVHMPYFPVWLDGIGLSAAEIALLGSVPLFMRIVATPVAGFLADRSGRPALVLLAVSWATFLAFVLVAQGRNFLAVLAATILFAAAWTPVLPLCETVAIGVVRRAGLDYGRMRLWGSVAFIATNMAGGWLLERAGTGSIVWMIGAMCLLSALAAHALLATDAGQAASHAQGNLAARRISVSDVAKLMRNRPFLLFMLATGAVQSAHAMFYMFGILHWRAQGISAAWAGALWAVSIVVEVILFAYAKVVFARFAPTTLILAGCLAAVARWSAMGLDPPLLALVPLQVMHVLTFGASHLGAIQFLSRTIPEHQTGSAQAIHAAVAGGIANGLVILSVGPLYAAFGGRAYWAMAVVAAIGLAATLLIMRRPPPPSAP